MSGGVASSDTAEAGFTRTGGGWLAYLHECKLAKGRTSQQMGNSLLLLHICTVSQVKGGARMAVQNSTNFSRQSMVSDKWHGYAYCFVCVAISNQHIHCTAEYDVEVVAKIPLLEYDVFCIKGCKPQVL